MALQTYSSDVIRMTIVFSDSPFEDEVLGFDWDAGWERSDHHPKVFNTTVSRMRAAVDDAADNAVAVMATGNKEFEVEPLLRVIEEARGVTYS